MSNDGWSSWNNPNQGWDKNISSWGITKPEDVKEDKNLLSTGQVTEGIMKLKGHTSFATAFGLALEVNRVADETGRSPMETFAKMRKDGVIECDDAVAAAMAAMLRR